MVTELEQVYEDAIDYLGRLQTVSEQAIYHILLRRSHFMGTDTVRLGQRTLAQMGPLPSKAGSYNKGQEIKRSSQAQVKKVLESLAGKGHIVILDTTFQGTLLRVKLPREIPECLVLMERAATKVLRDSEDFYTVPANRLRVYERDQYKCRYCERPVTPQNTTLDHIKPLSLGGNNSLANLVTCCLSCNSIKAARNPDESLVDLLDRFKASMRLPTNN